MLSMTKKSGYGLIALCYLAALESGERDVDGKLVRPDYEEDEVTQAALVVYQGEVRF